MKRGVKRFYRLVAIVVFVLLGQIGGQSAKFYNVNALYGISLREVNSISCDNNGFIWASSKAGVLRLSHDDYRIYDIPYDNSKTNVLTVSLIHHGSNLIAYTDNGQVFVLNPISDQFELMFDLCQLLETRYINIHDVVMNDSGALWVATSLGVYKFHLGQLSLELDIKKETILLEGYDDHRMLVIRNHGVWLYYTQTKELQLIHGVDDLINLQVVSCNFDKQGHRLYMGTLSCGLFLYDFESKRFDKVLSDRLPQQPIRVIEKSIDSSLYIGIDGQGVWELDHDVSRVVNVYRESVDDPTSLRGNGVYDILCDTTGRVWVCTYSGGVSFFDLKSPMIQHVLHQPNNCNWLRDPLQ